MSETNRAGDLNARTDGDAPINKKPADLSKFQLRILAVLTGSDVDPKGVAIKRRLQNYYGKEVNHGQLYPNLDTLVESNLISKGQKDKRTNAYSITDEGREALASEVVWLTERAQSLGGLSDE